MPTAADTKFCTGEPGHLEQVAGGRLAGVPLPVGVRDERDRRVPRAVGRQGRHPDARAAGAPGAGRSRRGRGRRPARSRGPTARSCASAGRRPGRRRSSAVRRPLDARGAAARCRRGPGTGRVSGTVSDEGERQQQRPGRPRQRRSLTGPPAGRGRRPGPRAARRPPASAGGTGSQPPVIRRPPDARSAACLDASLTVAPKVLANGLPAMLGRRTVPIQPCTASGCSASGRRASLIGLAYVPVFRACGGRPPGAVLRADSSP